jgi:hypothetical protein
MLPLELTSSDKLGLRPAPALRMWKRYLRGCSQVWQALVVGGGVTIDEAGHVALRGSWGFVGEPGDVGGRGHAAAGRVRELFAETKVEDLLCVLRHDVFCVAGGCSGSYCVAQGRAYGDNQRTVGRLLVCSSPNLPFRDFIFCIN